MIESQRLKKKQKAQKILIKKEIFHTRKFVVVVKKQIIADNKIKRAAVRVAKKTQKNEKNRLKALNKKTNETKKKNKKKKTDMNFAFQKNLSASQQNLSAFQFSNVLIDLETNVYFDSNESASTEAYFDMFNSQSIE